MFAFIAGLIERTGYAGVALLMLLENLFPPLPSELIMPGVVCGEYVYVRTPEPNDDGTSYCPDKDH